MKKNKRYTKWVSWVCSPHIKPYCGSILSDTKKRAEAKFCEENGKRCRVFADCKIVHQKITIDMPPEIAAEYDKLIKHIGG